MAAAYSTGVTSSPTNFLQTLVTWLNTQGWVTDLSASDGDGWRAHLHKGGLYLNFRAANNEKIWPKYEPNTSQWDHGAGYGVGFYLGNGYDGGEGWYYQPGRPKRVQEDPYVMDTALGAGINLPSGPIAAYHFFDDGADNVTVVVERNPGIFGHLGWGPSMVKTGYAANYPYFFGAVSFYDNTYQGGATTQGVGTTASAPMAQSNAHSMGVGTYCLGQAFVKVDAAVFSDQWVSNACHNDWRYGYTGRWFRCAISDHGSNPGGILDEHYPDYRLLFDNDLAHQTAFLGALLLPLHCFVYIETVGRWAPLGYPPTIFSCSAVGNGYAQGEIYAVGGQNYMVFPNFAVLQGA